MPYLKLPRQSPPGGWRYFQPETKLWFNGDDQGFADMVERIVVHRKYRELSRSTFDEVLEDVNRQLCERLGPAHCGAQKGEAWSYIKQDFSNGINGETALAGSKALLDFILSGKKLNDEDESLSRAEVCRSCHLNTPAQGCGNCSALAQTTAKLVPENRRYSGLNVCAACGCGLQLKVNVPMEIVKSADADRGLTYPAHCWVNQT